MPAADRAVVLAQAVRSGLREPKSPERNARLEAYIDELDRLPESVFEQKFIAHNALNNYYRADDIDDGIIKHSTWIIDASQNVHTRAAEPAIDERRQRLREHG